MYKLRLPYKLDEINMIGCFEVFFFSKKKRNAPQGMSRLHKNEDLKFVMKLTDCVELFF